MTLTSDLPLLQIRKVPFLALVKMKDLGCPRTLTDFLKCLRVTCSEQQRDRLAI